MSSTMQVLTIVTFNGTLVVPVRQEVEPTNHYQGRYDEYHVSMWQVSVWNHPY
jgi:hypothetical protein